MAELQQYLKNGDEIIYRCCAAHLTADGTYLNETGKTKQQVEDVLKQSIFERKKATRVPEQLAKDIMTYLMNNRPGIAGVQEFTDEDITKLLPMFLDEIDSAAQTRLDGELGSLANPLPTQINKNGMHVIVIGAGPSGVAAGVKMREAGISFTIYERGTNCGGTWYHNTYPEAGCDVPSHFYSFSFAPNKKWSRHFSKSKEIATYVQDTAESWDLLPFIEFQTEVIGCRFNEKTKMWHVKTKDYNGNEKENIGNVVISACGQLSRPNIPPIKGKDDFEGPASHTAEWGKFSNISFKDRKVALVGTGASAMQLLRNIAKEAKELNVFQQIPSWFQRSPTYHKAVEDDLKWRIGNVPMYQEYYRFGLFWQMADGNYDALISGSELNERWRSMLTRYIKKQCGDDEELFKNILPDYPPYCSRVLVDNDWVQTLKRDNVNLIPNQVDRINARSLEAGGKEYDADIIIYSTGFKSNDFLFPMHVERDGVDIRQKWKDNGGAVAYKGVTVPGLPNFFMCYGPNTNLGHGGSIIFHSECQIRYIMGAIEKLNEMGAHGISLDVKEDKCEEYNQSAYSQLDKTVWGDAGCTSWYKTKDGRIVNNSPWTLLDYYTLTKEFDVQNYNISTSQNSSSKL